MTNMRQPNNSTPRLNYFIKQYYSSLYTRAPIHHCPNDFSAHGTKCHGIKFSVEMSVMII